MDTSSSNLIITGSEDGVVRLYDTRSPGGKLVNTYANHQRMVTSVKCNPKLENVFISGSADGTVKLWDLRNDEAPLCNLKHKHDCTDFKIFTTEWNGSS